MRKLTNRQIEYIDEHSPFEDAASIARAIGVDKNIVEEHVHKTRQPKTSSATGAGNFLSTMTSGWIYPLALFSLALIIRIVYIYQLKNSYFFTPFKGGFDDYIFDSWAMEILKGNWLGDSAIYIYRMPLYVYFLSLVYYLFGHSYLAVYIFQSIVGALTCVVVYRIGSIYFTPIAGLTGGLLTAFYGPFLYYTGMLVGETLGIFLTCLSFLFLLFFQKKSKYVNLFIAGILMGLSMLARGNMLIVLPFVIFWLIVILRKEKIIKLVVSIVITLIGVLIAITPIIIRNYVIEKDVVPITALGGLNIYIGNAYGSDGKYHIVPKVGNSAETMVRDSIRVAEDAAGRKLKPSEVSNFWLRETMKSIKEHGVGYLLPLLFKKLVLFWNSYELPDIWDYYFIRNYIPVLNLPFINFSIISALASIGICFSWPRRKDLSLLFTIVLGYMISLIAVFIISRYRAQVVPFLSVPAGFAIASLFNLKRIGFKRVVYGFALGLFVFMFCNLPVDKVSFETSYNSLGVLMKREGRFEDAIALYNRAIEIAPAYPSPYYNLGILYRDIDRRDEAASYFRKALEVSPDFYQAKERLAELS
ncbi:MAG: glycosyltransferase family 39 protein [Candidatus Omnitrophica bacterium]|nr:glycosyltransferase family 39 protein [Candidatus Omnitrophota bacterium]